MDQAFDQAFVRSFSRQARSRQASSRQGLGALPAQAESLDPTGVGRAPVGLGMWDTATQGPLLPGLQPSDPPPGAPTWWNYAWVYMTTGGYPIPTAPPPGVTAGAGPVVGSWVETRRHHWVWFAPDNALTQINGVWVLDNSNAPATSTPWSAFPQPTQSPDGTQGTWSEPHQGYWVWTPGTAGAAGAAVASAPAPAMSTGTIVLLTILGLGAVGGVGYLLFD